MSKAHPHTKRHLLYLLELNEIAPLFQQLKEIVHASANDEQNSNTLVLLLNRYNHYLKSKEMQSAENSQIEFRQIQHALLQFIQSLALPEGELSLAQKSHKNWHELWKNLLRSKWRWSVFSALVALLLIGIGQFRLGDVEVDLKCRVSQIGFHTQNEWKIGQGQDLMLQRFETDFVQEVSFWDQNASTLGAPFGLMVSGNCRLDELFIPAKSTLTLIADHDNLLIKPASGKIKGNLYLQAVQVTIPEADYQDSLGLEEGGEQFSFIGDEGASFLLDAPQSDLNLPLVEIDSLGFQRISFEQDSSTIKSGFIKIEGKLTELALGDRLKLSGLKKARLRLLRCDRDLEIEIKGNASKIRINQGGLSKSLMPTWLSYLYSDQTIIFYVSVFMTLFGLLYPLRSALFAK